MKKTMYLLFLLLCVHALNGMEQYVPPVSMENKHYTHREKYEFVWTVLTTFLEKNIFLTKGILPEACRVERVLTALDSKWQKMNLLGLPACTQRTEQALAKVQAMEQHASISFKHGMNQYPLLAEHTTCFFVLMRIRSIDTYCQIVVDDILERYDFFKTFLTHMHTQEVQVELKHLLFLPLHAQAVSFVSDDHKALYKSAFSLFRLYVQKDEMGRRRMCMQLESIKKHWLESVQPEHVYFYRKIREAQHEERYFLISVVQDIYTHFSSFLSNPTNANI